MTIASAADFDGMQRVGQLVARTIQAMRLHVRAGVTTGELDTIGAAFAQREGARSAPQLTYGFPGFTCISVNEQIVHGVPGAQVLRDGDLVTLDVTLEFEGYWADSAVTVPVGTVGADARRVMRAARVSFQRGMEAARAGRTLRHVGAIVEQTARAEGASVFRTLAGHGIGRKLHEDPMVPNWADPESRDVLHEGLVIALEPMVSLKPSRVVEEADGWTLRTHNRSLSAHHEHTLMIRTDAAPVVLTALAA